MFTAFIIFLPFAILMAFAFKNWQPYWFYVHITAIVLALVSAAAGLVIGFTLIQDDMYEWVHKWVGTAVVAALLLQVCPTLALDALYTRKVWRPTPCLLALLRGYFSIEKIFSGGRIC
jgi:hypothetical protein